MSLGTEVVRGLSVQCFPFSLCETGAPCMGPQGGYAEQTSPTPLWTWHRSEKSALLLEASEVGGWIGICYCSIAKLILTNAGTLQ